MHIINNLVNLIAIIIFVSYVGSDRVEESLKLGEEERFGESLSLFVLLR